MIVKIVRYGSDEYKKSVELREKILRKPLGLVFDEEFLRQDANQVHIAAIDGEKVVGTLVLKSLGNNRLKMRQVAVDTALQNKGIGRAMVVFAENYAKENNFSVIELHARKTAVEFYLKSGYSVTGNEFYEVGIPHLKMLKKVID